MLKKYFIAGLLVWLPIFFTLYVIHLLLNGMDSLFALLPNALRPDIFLGYHVPGLEIALSFFIIFISGLLVTNFLGRWFLSLGEGILSRIPLVRSIYSAAKQVLGTLLASKETSFRKVLLVEYPRAGLWSLAFQTNNGFQGTEADDLNNLITIFVPSAPSPLSGFLIMLPSSQVRELKMSVDEALKMIISLGMVVPGPKKLKKDK